MIGIFPLALGCCYDLACLILHTHTHTLLQVVSKIMSLALLCIFYLKMPLPFQVRLG
jgi:hypothetical protein